MQICKYDILLLGGQLERPAIVDDLFIRYLGWRRQPWHPGTFRDDFNTRFGVCPTGVPSIKAQIALSSGYRLPIQRRGMLPPLPRSKEDKETRQVTMNIINSNRSFLRYHGETDSLNIQYQFWYGLVYS